MIVFQKIGTYRLSTYRSWASRARLKLATEIAIPLFRSRL